MADYTGQSCFVCQKPFEPEDDVVVCPECGTPYHRACWQHYGHCINVHLHENGESWKPVEIPLPESETASETRRCPRCGTENPVHQAFCGHCGMILEENGQQQTAQQNQQTWQQSAQDICCGLDPNEDYEGERLEDLANFVRTNTIYYVPVFKKFRETGSKLTMNLISAVFPHLYFASRKMWGMTFLIISVLLLLDLPSELYSFVTNNDSILSQLHSMQQSMNSMGSMGGMYNNFLQVMSEQIQSFCTALLPYETALHTMHIICMYLSFAVRVLLFAFSNYIYYRFVLRKVHRIRAEGLPEGMTKDRLRMAGGTNYWFVLIAILAQYAVTVLVTALFLLGISMAF